MLVVFWWKYYLVEHRISGGRLSLGAGILSFAGPHTDDFEFLWVQILWIRVGIPFLLRAALVSHVPLPQPQASSGHAIRHNDKKGVELTPQTYLSFPHPLAKKTVTIFIRLPPNIRTRSITLIFNDVPQGSPMRTAQSVRSRRAEIAIYS
jgi:hypothetical protein